MDCPSGNSGKFQMGQCYQWAAQSPSPCSLLSSASPESSCSYSPYSTTPVVTLCSTLYLFVTRLRWDLKWLSAPLCTSLLLLGYAVTYSTSGLHCVFIHYKSILGTCTPVCNYSFICLFYKIVEREWWGTLPAKRLQFTFTVLISKQTSAQFCLSLPLPPCMLSLWASNCHDNPQDWK